MCSGNESSQIGEVQVLRDQEAFVTLGGIPDIAVGTTAQTLLGNSMNIVGEIRQDRGDTRW